MWRKQVRLTKNSLLPRVVKTEIFVFAFSQKLIFASRENLLTKTEKFFRKN
jgi:hypothetical protein